MKTGTPSQRCNPPVVIPGFMNKMRPPSVRVLFRRAVTRIVRNPQEPAHA